MGDAEQFRALEDLADLFEKGAVAGTRAAVDEKWVDHASQVGQSGKTIKPDVYFAFGVSGAMQHTSGMKDSGLVIAVNKDENAPILNSPILASSGTPGNPAAAHGETERTEKIKARGTEVADCVEGVVYRADSGTRQ